MPPLSPLYAFTLPFLGVTRARIQPLTPRTALPANVRPAARPARALTTSLRIICFHPAVSGRSRACWLTRARIQPLHFAHSTLCAAGAVPRRAHLSLVSSLPDVAHRIMGLASFVYAFSTRARFQPLHSLRAQHSLLIFGQRRRARTPPLSTSCGSTHAARNFRVCFHSGISGMICPCFARDVHAQLVWA